MNKNSLPPYPARPTGACLVCGNAWTLMDDFARACVLRPDAPVLAVNGAAGQVRADFLFSVHFEKLPRWMPLQTERFGAGFTVHGVGSEIKKKQAQREAEGPFVDYWWPEAKSAGTSTWGGAKLAKLMGFDEVVLCGMPLDHGPYADGTLANDFTRPKIVDHYRKAILADGDWYQGISAMSGWTKEQFGEPV